MPKLAKNMWTNSKGERKVNCYLINLSKEIVSQTNITEEDEVKIYVKDNKIIIEKADINDKIQR